MTGFNSRASLTAQNLYRGHTFEPMPQAASLPVPALFFRARRLIPEAIYPAYQIDTGHSGLRRISNQLFTFVRLRLCAANYGPGRLSGVVDSQIAARYAADSRQAAHFVSDDRDRVMEKSIEIFAAINFFIMGVSHMVRPRCWAAFFLFLRSQGEVGSFINGFITLAMGSMIVAFHNVWTGLPAILTVLGWAYVIKSLLIFTVPGFGMRSISGVTEEKANMFIVPGAILVGVSVVLGYIVVRG